MVKTEKSLAAMESRSCLVMLRKISRDNSSAAWRAASRGSMVVLLAGRAEGLPAAAGVLCVSRLASVLEVPETITEMYLATVSVIVTGC